MKTISSGLLILALSMGVAFGTQQAIPLKEKVEGSDLIVVATVINVRTVAVHHCTFTVDTNRDVVTAHFERRVPFHDVQEYLSSLADLRRKMEDDENQFGQGEINNIRRDYFEERVAECRILETVVGTNTSDHVDVVFKWPVDGYASIPQPWRLEQGKDYVLFLSKVLPGIAGEFSLVG